MISFQFLGDMDPNKKLDPNRWLNDPNGWLNDISELLCVISMYLIMEQAFLEMIIACVISYLNV